MRWIVAGAIINFEGKLARKYFVNFWEYKYFWESNCSSRSVIEMMRHFDMKRYPRLRGKNLYTTLGRRLFKVGDYSRGSYYSRKYGIRNQRIWLPQENDWNNFCGIMLKFQLILFASYCLVYTLSYKNTKFTYDKLESVKFTFNISDSL